MKNGRFIDYHSNGKIEIICDYVDVLQHGDYIVYDNDVIKSTIQE